MRWYPIFGFCLLACGSSGELAYSPAASSTPPITCASGTCSIDDAVASALSASSPQTIVLAAGSYSLSLPITGSISFVSADEPALESTGQSTQGLVTVLPACNPSSPAAVVSAAPNVTLQGANGTPILVATKDSNARIGFSGLALSGNAENALTITSGTAAIARSLVGGSLVISGPNARASVENSVVSGPSFAIVAEPASPKLQRNDFYLSTVPCHRAGIKVVDGAEYVGSNVEIRESQERGICVHASSALLCNGSIHGTRQSSDAKYGRGAEALSGAALTLRGTHIYDNYEAGVLAADFSTQVTLRDRVEIDSQKPSTQLTTSVAIVSQERATVTATDLSVHDNNGLGALIETASTASFSTSNFSRNRGAGVVVYDGNTTIASSTIDHTTGDASLDLGMGVLTMRQSSLTMTGSTISANRYAGAWLAGATGRVDISSSTFSDHAKVALGATSVAGNGIYASGRCADLVLGTNTFTGNEGPHIFLHGAYATLSSSAYSINGLEFVSQKCVCPSSYTLGELEGLGLPDATTTADLCPTTNHLVPPLSFGIYLSEVEAL